MTTRPNATPAIAVIGPGAIGSLLAARLAFSGRGVLLIGRDPLWLADVRRHGLVVSSGYPEKQERLGSNPILAMVEPVGPKCSEVIFCVKSGDTASAIRKARHWIGPDTTVVSLQNGLSHRPMLLSAFGRRRTVFGVCYIGAERLARAHIRHHGGWTIALGARRDNTEAVQEIRSIFGQAGFDIKIDSSEDRLLWGKTAFNAATNPLGALTGRTNGELLSLPPLKELMLRALREAVAAARAAGHPLAYKQLERQLISGLRSMPRQPNSMLQDLRAGRRTEIDAILMPILQAAKRKRIKTPLLDSLHKFTIRLSRELARGSRVS